MHSDLEFLQQTFANALLDIGGVESAVEAALTTFKGNVDLNRGRFAIYRGNIRAIWQQTCANAYPVLKQLVGDEFFNDLTRAFGLAHASRSGNLAEFGAALPGYIDTLENCRDYPYLADVAALEWQVHQAYYAEQTIPVTLAQLAVFAPERLTELRLKLQKTCGLFQSPWAVADIWQAHQEKDLLLPENIATKNHCLIWRLHGLGNWKVRVSTISTASYLALQALAGGNTLGQALEVALEEDPEFAVQTELADWLSKQLFSEIIPDKIGSHHATSAL